MNVLVGERPGSGEYDPFYETYVGRIGAGSVLSVLSAQVEALRELFSSLVPGGEDYRYAAGKWSVLDILGHLNDSERIFGMRATCIARGETQDLPGFEQDDYVAAGNFDQRQVDSMIREFESLRAANVEMLSGLVPEDWNRRGRANGSPISVRAIGWILAGHVDHHLAVLSERYGQAFSS